MNKRRQIRVLVVGALCAAIAAVLLLSAWTLWYLPYGRQILAASAVDKLGGKVEIEVNGPRWMRAILGDRYVADVVSVELANDQITDNDLSRLSVFRNLKFLGIVNPSRVTDAGLLPLKALPKLEKLYIGAVPVTDGGLVNLNQLYALKELLIQESEVTDAGIIELEQLTNLERLGIYDNERITDSCIPSIAKLTKLKVLELMHTGVSDTGLGHLTHLKDLRTVKFGKLMGYPREAQLMDALGRDLPQTFESAPLSDVLDFLQDSLDVTILIDEISLTEEGIDPKTPITCDSKKTFESNLNSILNPLGLVWFVESDSLLITTASGASQKVPAGVLKLQAANPDVRIQWKL